MTGGAPGGEQPPTTEGAEPDVLGGEGVAGRVVRGGAQRMIGFGAANLLAAIATVLLLRYLGVEDFGRYGTVMALMTIVGGLTDAGLNVIGTRELALLGRGEERRRMTGDILGIRLVLALAGVALSVGFAALVGYDAVMVAGAAVAGVGVIAIAAQAASCLPAQVDLRNGRLAVVETMKAVIQVVVTAALVVAGAALLPFFAVQAAVGVGILLMLPLILGRGTFVRPRYDREAWVRVMRAALPVAIAGVLSVLYLRIVIVIASLILDERETGLLVTSARIVEVAGGIPLLLVGVMLPVATVAARDDPARLRYVAQKLLEVGVLLGVVAALALGYGASVAVLVLGGSAYADAASVLAIQGLTILTIFVVQACVVVLVATHHQTAIVRANAIGLVVIVGAAFALLPAADAVGGAIATVIADTVLALAMLAAVHRAGVTPQLGLLPRIMGAGALGAAAGVATLALPALVTTAAALAVFTAAALLLRAVPSEILDTVRAARG